MKVNIHIHTLNINIKLKIQSYPRPAAFNAVTWGLTRMESLAETAEMVTGLALQWEGG